MLADLFDLLDDMGEFLLRPFAFIKRNYEKASNKKLSDSSWYERFTPELVAFLKLCVTLILIFQEKISFIFSHKS
jgi:hypothetical protein